MLEVERRGGGGMLHGYYGKEGGEGVAKSPPGVRRRRKGGGLLPTPSHPTGMLRSPYSQRRGRAGRLSLGSQIFWMRLCVSSMGIFKTKVFLRSASTLVRVREGQGEEKKRKEGGKNI